MSPQTQALRITGGEYRGRRLQFKTAADLRPTGERVRETLFNWLQPVIVGARCLDMFAGSGLLGMEAISRGAADAVFVEQNRETADQLRDNIDKLGLLNAQVIHADAMAFVPALTQPFDVIFVDPPFHKALLVEACNLLEAHGLARSAARIYLESEKAVSRDALPSGWALLRNKQAGRVFYHLVTKH